MSGVEILATEEIVSEYAYSWSTFFITFSVLLCVFVIIGIIFHDIPFFMFLGLFCGFIIGGLFGDVNKVPIEYKTQHKVLISDEVLMNDFLSKYEIVDQEEKIYTVVEKE